MISEKQFAASHTAFWHQLLPMAEEYVRTRNRSLGRFAPPLVSNLPPETRGVVNEVGFRLFVASLRFNRSVRSVPKRVADSCIQDGLRHIRALREHGRTAVPPPKSEGVHEARVLAQRLVEFFDRATTSTLQPFPRYQGCGWIDSCAGDVFAEGTLFEVKAGERRFRTLDLRQLLIYSALDFAGKTIGVVKVCLVNPRIGLFLHEPLEKLCQDLAGRPATEVLGEIVEYASEPLDRYVAG